MVVIYRWVALTGQDRDTTTILIMIIRITTFLIMILLITTLLKMTLLITLNTGGITFNDITYNFNKCKITYKLLSTVMSKVI
jgi:hypothetical protein